MVRPMRRWWWMLALWPVVAGAVPSAELSRRVLCTDETVELKVTELPAEVRGELTVQAADGTATAETLTGAFVDGRLQLKPRRQGWHRLTLAGLPGTTLSFLAVAPPAAADAATLKRLLPQNGWRLFGAKPFTVMALGDSAAADALWPEVLRLLLARACGNPAVKLVNRARVGATIEDAALRFPADTTNPDPDLAILMFGNDEPAPGLPAESYVEQAQWLVNHLASERRCDTLLCQPVGDGRERNTAILCEAELLRGVAATTKSPLALTYPIAAPYPEARQVALARAAFAALTQPLPASPLKVDATWSWSGRGVSATVVVSNVSAAPRSGWLETLPRPDERLQAPARWEYQLEPYKRTSFEVTWPEVKAPSDLWKYPADRYLAPGRPLLPVLDHGPDGVRAYVAAGRFDVDTTFLRRVMATGEAPTVSMEVAGHWHDRTISLPPDTAVGRLNLLEPTILRDWPERIGWAAAEVAFQRMAAAEAGEARVDGDLREWKTAVWTPLGEPCQARGWRGPEDKRATPADGRLEWAFRAGHDSLFAAARGTGKLTGDSFSLYFDTRPIALLCTAGPGYWVDGKLAPNGAVELAAGPTSTGRLKGLSGAWRATPTGLELELRLPYGLLDLNDWPTGGDLGLELIWRHGASGTTLVWSGDTPAPSPRTFGALHHLDVHGEALPWLVRVR